MPTKNIKVAIADDHTMFRKTLASAVNDFKGIRVMLEAEDGKDLLQKLKENPCDVVLMDIEMPNMDGIEATARVTEEYPDMRIIVISQYDEYGLMESMIMAGANGYLLKTDDPEVIEEAIHSVVDKGLYFNETLGKGLFYSIAKKRIQKLEKLKEELTAIETDTLKLICRQYSTIEIANELNKSKRTVEGYRSELLSKTGSKNSAGLALYAIKNGIVKLDEVI